MRLSLAAAAMDADVARSVAIVTAQEEVTFADLAARASRARTALKREGVNRGARVTLRARNDVATVVVVHALIDLGATIVPIHPRLTEAEARELCVDAAPALSLDEGDLLRLFESPADDAPLEDVDPNLTLAIVYTSGTTGRAKGAVLSRRAFLASADASAANLGWRADDRWLMCMPVCHVGGLSIITRCLLARRPILLEGRFDPEAVLRAVNDGKATLLSVVPTMLRALLDADDADNAGVLGKLRAILVGGAATPDALLRSCEERGVVALTTYGLTEACSQVTVQSPPAAAGAYRARLDSGRALPGTEVRIVGGPVGRIQVRGPTLMDGYFAGPGVEPRRIVDAEGWLETGDLGELDGEGSLRVHARRTDLIVTGGENVYPVDVEQRLERLPGVLQALVFGVADDRWGQVVAAALVLAEGASLEDIAEASRIELAPHKRPRLACRVAALPLTSSGKVQRANVADRYARDLHPFAPARRVG